MISSVQVPAVSGVLSFVWAVVVPWSCEDFHRRTRLADRGSGGCFNDLNNLLAGVGVHLHFATGQPFCPSFSIFVGVWSWIFREVCVVFDCALWVGESFDMYLALATGHGNVDETASVKNTLVGATLGVLLLLLGLNLDAKLSLKRPVGWMATANRVSSGVGWKSKRTHLRSGSLDLTGTGERAVNLTHVG